MDFSFWPTTAQSWDSLLAGCRSAETRGWHGIWVPDHFMTNVAVGPPVDEELAPWLEGWTTLSAVAALVPRVRIGTMVSGNLYRHPALVANMAGTVDEISGGRCVVGLGAGWQENEHARYGIDLGTARERSDRLEEAARMIRGLLDHPRTSHAGEYYSLDEAPCEPSGSNGKIPLLIGGKGEKRTLRTVAHYADEWNMWAFPDEIPPKRQVIRRWCDDAGRDADEIRVTVAAMMRNCGSSTERGRVLDRLGNHGGLVGASWDEIGTAVMAYADAGVKELVVADFNLPLDRREELLAEFDAEVVQTLL